MAERGGRPKAWGVLAVSLALMALVAALSSTAGHRATTPLASSTPRAAPEPTRRRAVAQRTASSSGGDTSVSGSRPAGMPAIGRRGVRRVPHEPRGHAGRQHTATVAGSVQAPAVHLASTPAAGSLAATGIGAQVATSVARAEGSSAPSAEGTGAGASPALVSGSGATGTTGSSSAAGSTAATANSSPGATTPTGPTGPLHRGSLSFATTSATVSVPGGSTVNATASWSGTPTLQLTITCPDGVSASRRGPSGLSLEVDDTAGGPASCDVRLSTPPGVRADVAFTLTVEPAQ